ncbi:peptidoglycan DD-metalloendopeptidase family protein, partial [Candidatus Woesebacteria bacterium]|nr:peptidoglycan DD-metalloendopeptidase family protein [Candidatus Woesebacteria bacterium]
MFSKIFLATSVFLMLVVCLTNVVSASTLGTWTPTLSLPLNLASHQGFVDKNNLYLIGGGSFGNTSAVLQGKLNFDGEVTAWDTISNTPVALMWHMLSRYTKYIYLLGGATVFPTNSVNTVYRASINPDGTLSPWTLENPLPQRLSLGGTFTFNEKIYYLGGLTQTEGGAAVLNDQIYMTSINPSDGSLSSWSTIGALPEPRSSFVTTLSNDKIIILGGKNPNVSDTVIYAQINSQGFLSEWTSLSSLPMANQRPASLIIDNKLFLFGGHNGSYFLDTIYFSNLDTNGLPNTWTLSEQKLPGVNCCFPMLKTNSNIYITGGHNGGYLVDVYKSSIQSTPEPMIEPFELPIDYVGRNLGNPFLFKSTFWEKLTASFDHTLRGGEHRPFTGATYKNPDCPNGVVGISCYDGHNGTDFSGSGDRDVYSVGNGGTVIFASDHTLDSCTPNKGGYGCVVVAQYPDGHYVLYAHLEKIYLNEGASLNTNIPIGYMGKTGCPSCGVHLHMGVLTQTVSPLLSFPKAMSRNDWQELLFQARSTSAPRYKP